MVCTAKTLADLGYDRVQSVLAGLCQSERGREMALALLPTADRAELESRRRLVEQAWRLYERAGRPSLSFPDLRDLLERVGRGDPFVEPRELLDVAAAEQVARDAARLTTQCDRDRDGDLLDRLERIEDHSALVTRILAVVAPDGTVKDNASHALARLRSDLIGARQKIQADLLGFLRQNSDAGQEQVITERNGRYVVPIKADHRGRVDGFVHDYSATRRTAFMEPVSFVRENNRIQELIGEERDEVLRILRELASALRAAAAGIARNQDELSELDRLFATAALAIRHEARLCELADEDVQLLGARHPLLSRQGCVPIDLRLDRSARLLLISGPNGGGKTVALKTLGLLVLMNQAGLALPVEPGSRLCLFEHVAVDIGDPQQLGSDSTYTGHLRVQKQLLAEAGGGWLVMLDEVGSGTDPDEGGALGTAVLETLVEHGARVVATTHLLRVKAFAHGKDWALLAATELDPETHEPTFRLLYGVPGRSNALQIAENLAFPASVLERALARLQTGQLEFEGLLRELESARKAHAEAEARARREQDQAALARRQYELKRSQGFAEGLRSFQDESGELLSKLRELAQRPSGAVSKGEVRRVERQIGSLGARARPQGSARGERPAAPARSIVVGDRVLVVPLGIRGEVLDLDEKRRSATVQGPRFSVSAALSDLEWISSAAERVRTPQPEAAPSLEEARPADKSVRFEVDLRGLRVEEGLELAERYLSDASLSGLPSVRIIHGMGTGRLRTAIQEMLRKHPLVVEFRDGGEGEGGLGVTVAKLSD